MPSVDGTDHGHCERQPVAGDKDKSVEKDIMNRGFAGEGTKKEKESSQKIGE